jgi:antitoxin PrlF
MQGHFRVKVSVRGRLTVPKAVRENLGIGPSDEISFEVGPDGVKVVPVRATNPFAHWEGRWRTGEGLTSEEIDAWILDIRGPDEGDVST